MEDDGVICISCGEWFEVWTNAGSPGLCYCPLCGYEFTKENLEKMFPDEEETPCK